MDAVEERVKYIQSVIVKACILAGLNITVYDGKIGFVDQTQRKLVALWEPQHTLNEIYGGGENGICS